MRWQKSYNQNISRNKYSFYWVCWGMMLSNSLSSQDIHLACRTLIMYCLKNVFCLHCEAQLRMQSVGFLSLQERSHALALKICISYVELGPTGTKFTLCFQTFLQQRLSSSFWDLILYFKWKLINQVRSAKMNSMEVEKQPSARFWGSPCWLGVLLPSCTSAAQGTERLVLQLIIWPALIWTGLVQSPV